MIRRLLPASLLAIVAVSSPLFAAPADSVRIRIDGFRELGASFKTVNDSLRGPTPQTMLIQIASRQIVGSARAMPGWFPLGSGPEASPKTKAKPEIWKQAPKFKAAMDAFIRQANVFQQAAQSGNANAIRGEARKLGLTCKGCHDSFKAPSN